MLNTAVLNLTQILVFLKLRLFDYVKDDVGMCSQCNPHVYSKMTNESILRYDYGPFSSQ